MKLKLYVEGSMILGIGVLLFVLSSYARHALDWTMAICCILMTGVFFLTTFRKIQRHIKSDIHYLHSIGVLFAVTLVYMAGYGDITAESHLARLMLTREMLLGFGTSVFAISIFASLVPND